MTENISGRENDRLIKTNPSASKAEDLSIKRDPIIAIEKIKGYYKK